VYDLGLYSWDAAHHQGSIPVGLFDMCSTPARIRRQVLDEWTLKAANLSGCRFFEELPFSEADLAITDGTAINTADGFFIGQFAAAFWTLHGRARSFSDQMGLSHTQESF
jgi:hypothetical protein